MVQNASVPDQRPESGVHDGVVQTRTRPVGLVGWLRWCADPGGCAHAACDSRGRVEKALHGMGVNIPIAQSYPRQLMLRCVPEQAADELDVRVVQAAGRMQVDGVKHNTPQGGCAECSGNNPAVGNGFLATAFGAKVEKPLGDEGDASARSSPRPTQGGGANKGPPVAVKPLTHREQLIPAEPMLRHCDEVGSQMRQQRSDGPPTAAVHSGEAETLGAAASATAARPALAQGYSEAVVDGRSGRCGRRLAPGTWPRLPPVANRSARGARGRARRRVLLPLPDRKPGRDAATEEPQPEHRAAAGATATASAPIPTPRAGTCAARQGGDRIRPWDRMPGLRSTVARLVEGGRIGPRRRKLGGPAPTLRRADAHPALPVRRHAGSAVGCAAARAPSHAVPGGRIWPRRWPPIQRGAVAPLVYRHQVIGGRIGPRLSWLTRVRSRSPRLRAVAHPSRDGRIRPCGGCPPQRCAVVRHTVAHLASAIQCSKATGRGPLPIGTAPVALVPHCLVLDHRSPPACP